MLYNRIDNSILIKCSSEIYNLELILDEVKNLLDELDKDDSIKVCLVIRELLMNAIVHGNKNNPNSLVSCSLKKMNSSQFKITVEDEGSGFDYRSLEMNLPEDPKNIRRRGYILINALSDQIEFNREGNQITVYVTIN